MSLIFHETNYKIINITVMTLKCSECVRIDVESAVRTGKEEVSGSGNDRKVRNNSEQKGKSKIED